MILKLYQSENVQTFQSSGILHMQLNKHAHIHYLWWPAAGKLILGLVVWVAQYGLGSSVGVKELPSELYHLALQGNV